ncbi:MAG TPA: ATP-binding protein [Bryobacteraceae bacterium]
METDEKVDILLVDDDAAKLLALENILAGLGQNLVKAHSGNEALRFLLKQDFAVVLLDVRMPGMDGFETAAMMREREKSAHLPIIFVTAADRSEAYPARGYLLGAVDYIHTPIVPEFLRAKVAVFVELKLQRERLCRIQAQLRQQNLELEEKNRRLEAASRMKSQFLANMSHELRSPLNGIIGFSELLWDGKLGALPERPREFVGRIHASATHLLQLINSLLDLSKIEAGHLTFCPERVLVFDVIQEVTGVLGALASGKGIPIETDIDASVDEVMIDPGRLKQVLYNYLSNALKFTGENGRVVIRLKPEGTGEFRLEISDTGIGIPAENIQRLFVEFEQLDTTTAKRYPGTGLGLALTKRIVEAQGGRVGVESSPGRGSTFFAVLPRVPPSVAAREGECQDAGGRRPEVGPVPT